MEEEDKNQLRKFIRETISREKGLINETIPDEAFSDALPVDLKAWLFYYKHYTHIAEETIGRMLKSAMNYQISDKDKLDEIMEEWRTFQSKRATLPTPNLN